MSHIFTLYKIHKLWVPVSKTKILEYTMLYIEMVEVRLLFGQSL